MTVTLTEKAQSRLQSFLQTSKTTNPASKGIRVWVNNGGCSGYEYQMEVTNSPQPEDLVVQQGQVVIYVDAKSAPLLEGVIIDFVDGVMEGGFKFTNPNASDTCGCGKSFKTGNCSSNGVPCS
ncbi:HesB/IscA family protein [Mastigocoleus testarum]|uniref:Fe-S cluster assembly protein HesB n=1 Tax=Mastigocoleus testarum BC008 TaxID=371196 RepID=A0A0V7ZI45_9CYAN|nr:iron-sulfur cluster assembly accessory protein [Mastigocoleus testarum]KST64249.1 Fe-S cluster assembly protein HesB [Mastigocoleus testarum BC008]